jgi:endonuclease YncB( thermonuclease family)
MLVCFFIAKIALSCAVVFIWLPTRAVAETINLHGLVVGVTDGDTLRIRSNTGFPIVIRLQGIDAPETTQAYGLAATAVLRESTLHKRVTAECNKTDRYRRQVCLVKVDGVDVGLQMLLRGHAWHYKRFSSEQTQQKSREYAEAENEAVAQRRGLWQQDAPEAPWDWRAKKHRSR